MSDERIGGMTGLGYGGGDYVSWRQGRDSLERHQAFQKEMLGNAFSSLSPIDLVAEFRSLTEKEKRAIGRIVTILAFVLGALLLIGAIGAGAQKLWEIYRDAQVAAAKAKWTPALEAELRAQNPRDDLPVIEQFMTQNSCHRTLTTKILAGHPNFLNCESDGARGMIDGYLGNSHFSTGRDTQEISSEVDVFPLSVRWVNNPRFLWEGQKPMDVALKLFGRDRLFLTARRRSCILVVHKRVLRRKVWQGGVEVKIYAATEGQSLACPAGDEHYRLVVSKTL